MHKEVSGFLGEVVGCCMEVHVERELVHVLTVPFVVGVVFPVLLILFWGQMAEGSLVELFEEG